jgi:hypothetical protein
MLLLLFAMDGRDAGGVGTVEISDFGAKVDRYDGSNFGASDFGGKSSSWGFLRARRGQSCPTKYQFVAREHSMSI